MELAMPSRITSVQLDAPTSRAVAKGIGEKLQQTLVTETRFPDRLQKLLDALSEREANEASAGKRGG